MNAGLTPATHGPDAAGSAADRVQVGVPARTPARSRVVALVALACGAAWIVLLYPGFMSPDSAEQLTEVRSGVLSDWHSPIMVLLWMATERMVAGPGGMLVLNTVVLWSGLALLARRIAAPPPLQAAFLIALACAPPIVTLAGAIWKDVLLTALLTLAFGVAGRSLAFWPVALLATMSRHNAIPAVTIAVLLHLAPSGPTPSALWRALAASAVLLALAQGFNAAVVDTRTNPVQMVALSDLNGIASRTRTPAAVDACNQKTSEEPPPRAASMDEPKVRSALHATRLRLGFCFDEAASRTLLGEWVRMVLRQPREYADARALMAFRLLGFAGTPGNFVMTQSLYEGAAPSIEPPVPPTPAQLRLGAWIWALEARHVFRPWIYGVVGIAATVVAAWRRRWWPCAVALSGIVFELVLLLVAPSPDYRYSYWMIVSALIAATWLAAEAIARRAARADVTRRAFRAALPA